MRSRALVLLLLLVVPGCDSDDPTGAVTYPAKPIRIIVPFGAGGGTDSFARIIEQAIEEHDLLPEPVVIVNLGGAGGTIGSRRCKNAAPDGHTVMVLHNAIITAKQMRLVEFGPEAFEPVAGTGFVGQVIVVNEDSPYESLDDLMQAAKERPNEVKWATNIGALTHFSGLQLQQTRPGTAFRFVASGGGAERLADLLGGHVDVTGFSLEEFTRFRENGVRGLCILRRERYPELDVPTAVELGYDAWRDNLFYWWMPSGTPPERVEAFAAVLEEVMRLDEVEEKLTKGCIAPEFVRGDAMRRRLRDAEERNAKIVIPPPPSLPNVPLLTLVAVCVLATVVIVRSGREARLLQGSPASTTESPSVRSPKQRLDLAVGSVVLFTAYVTTLATGLVDFRLSTMAFVLLCGGLLVRFRPKPMLGLSAAAVLVGPGLHLVFTRVFEIVLP